MKLGIVGLPNVGKSTLFNSITKAGAQAANFPFCTIDPNVGVVAVPDERKPDDSQFHNIFISFDFPLFYWLSAIRVFDRVPHRVPRR